jgi:hypothetical protein
MGVAWALAIVITRLWTESSQPRSRRWVLIAVTLLVSAQLSVSAYRAYWWRQAGNTSESVMLQVENQLPKEQTDSAVWLVGLPDHLRHAYAFRNAFPEAAILLFPGWEIHALLDVDLAEGTREQAVEQVPCAGCAILWYENRVLERVQ